MVQRNIQLLSSKPRCQHIKTNGTRCGSPAQRNERFCYFHQQCRPIAIDFHGGYRDYSRSEVLLPAFEDAHSIQLTLRQVTELILRNKIDDKAAGLVLYALQIASSNLKRMELEKPRPTDVVVDPETVAETPLQLTPGVASADSDDRNNEKQPPEVDLIPKAPPEAKTGIEQNDDDLPSGTLQACHRENERKRNEGRRREQTMKQYVN